MSKRNREDSVSRLNKILPVPITLEDRTPSAQHFDSTSHITDVLVGDYHIIEGEIGKPYIVWSIRIIINDLNYSSILIYKRYSEIESFRNKLIANYKGVEIPRLPPKDNLNFQRYLWSSNWLESRRKGLQWFMTNVLLNPKLQHNEIVTEFVLS